jgi:hypothetical protein
MFSKRVTSALLFCALVQAAAPPSAHAGIWRWIEELSGPGPFGGPVLEVRAHCWDGKDLYPGVATATTDRTSGQKKADAVASFFTVKTHCLSGDVKSGQFAKVSLNFEFGRLEADPSKNQLVYDDGQPRRVVLYPVEAMVYWQPALGLEVGAGGGVFVFSTSRNTFARPVFEPMRLDIRPLDAFLPKSKKWMDPKLLRFLRSIAFRQSFLIFPKNMNARDFGASASNDFNESYDIVKSFELIFDCSALFRRL